jgi:hypothetical protein
LVRATIVERTRARYVYLSAAAIQTGNVRAATPKLAMAPAHGFSAA